MLAVVEDQGELAPNQVVVSLIALLKDEAAEVRSLAASALVDLGDASETVITSLLNLLKDDDAEVHSRAVYSLVNLGNASDKIESALVQWIEQHQTEDFVGNGIDALWKLVS